MFSHHVNSLCFFLSVLTAQTLSEKLKLERVIVLSRHNVRSPLSDHLADITPRPWPHWDEKNGYLTPKGVYLEGLMGVFFSEWLQGEGVLPEGCPDKNDVFVYANVKQRTKVTARAFVVKAFPECNVTVHVSDKSDSIFNPYVRNNTDAFKQLVLEKMQGVLDTLQLNASYELIEEILDYKDSSICKLKNKCALETDINIIKEIVAGEKPTVAGPLKISNTAVDAFLMQYYNGLALPDVAWGQLENDKRWKTLFNISEGYHSVIFKPTILAKDIAFPLINYLENIFINEETKFSMLMGHDSNILTVLTAMRFKPYVLPNQNEKAPIGGKIVFQKWNLKEKYFLKIQYVYASTSQLRVGTKLTLSKPPQFQILELEDCPIDKDGFCPWEDFKNLLVEF